MVPPSPSSVPQPVVGLLALPAELLTTIGFFAAARSTVGPPSTLLPLLLTHPKLASALSFAANPALYAAVLRQTFDTAAVGRRFGADVLQDARAQADDLRQRWRTLRTIRAFACDGAGWLGAHPGERGRAELEQAMLHVFLLLTENDGLNLPHILQWARLVHFGLAYQTNLMLPSAVAPGFPAETVAHGVFMTLSMWLDEAAEQMRRDVLAARGAQLGSSHAHGETADQTQEKMFVLRPFAFALHKYNPFFGPWNTPVLPLQEQSAGDKTRPREDERPGAAPARTSLFAADPEGNQGGIPLTLMRFGRQWHMKSTLLNMSSVFGLLNALDRDPRVGGVLTDSSNSSTASLDFIYTPAEAALRPAGRTPSYDPVSGTRLRRSVPLLHVGSRAWDNDVVRMMRCAELKAPGMKVSDWRGRFEGEWQGSFAFFDFNGYRDMLAGDEKALFENCFGQQGQQLILHEEVVYVPRASLGGTGSALYCGFSLDQDAAAAVVSRPCPFEEQDLDDEEGSEWVKEIMIYGTGRSNWGSFKFRGRVRAFDGLMTLLKEYASEVPDVSPATRGNWLYRGYVTGDSRIIGAWRDTFSPEDAKGYEGPFCLRKQDDAYLLPDQRPLAAEPTVSRFAEVMRSSIAVPLSAQSGAAAEPIAVSKEARSLKDVGKGENPLVTDGHAELHEGRLVPSLPPPPPASPPVILHRPVLAPSAESPSAQPRLPFLFPVIKPEEHEADKERKMDPEEASLGYGVAIYNQINEALRQDGCDKTAGSVPLAEIERTDVYPPELKGCVNVTGPKRQASGAPGLSKGKRRAPAHADGEGERSPKRQSSCSATAFSASLTGGSSFVHTRAHAQGYSPVCAKGDSPLGVRCAYGGHLPGRVVPGDASTSKGLQLYHGTAFFACAPGESVFDHRCDQTLGAFVGPPPSSISTTGAAAAAAGSRHPAALLSPTRFTPHRNRALNNLLDTPPPPPPLPAALDAPSEAS